MPKQMRVKIGNRAKGRRSAHNSLIGKYSNQRIRTERNRNRKRTKHLAFHPTDLQTLAAIKKLL